jgi:site-specific recombinase XerD
MRTQEAIAAFVALAASDQRLARHTVAAITSDLSVFAGSPHMPPEIRGLDRVLLDKHVTHLQEVRGLKLASVRRHIATIRRFAVHLVSSQNCNPDLLGWKPQLPKPRRLPRPVARTDARRILRACESFASSSSTTASALCLMMGVGLRIGEVCALNCGDFSSDGQRLHVYGKGSKERVVYISNSALRRRVRSQIAGRCESSPAFLNEEGGRLSTGALRRRITTLVRQAGIERRVTPHMFRHSAATWHLEAGIDIRIVQRLLGHASISTTEIYTQVADRHLELALSRADILRTVTAAAAT